MFTSKITGLAAVAAFAALLTGAIAMPANALPCRECDGGGGGPVRGYFRPPISPVLPPLTDKDARLVTLSISSIHALNTEDVGFFGWAGDHDEAYLIGAARLGSTSINFASSPMSITEPETRTPWGNLATTATLTGNDTIALGAKLIDEDVATDWNTIAPAARTIADGVTNAMLESGNSNVVTAGVIVASSFATFDFFATRDKDDYLGDVTADLRVGDLPIGTHAYTQRVNGTWGGGALGWSDWDYEVSFTVTVARV